MVRIFVDLHVKGTEVGFAGDSVTGIIYKTLV